MSDWLFEIRDQNGDNPVRLTGAYKRTVKLALNEPGECSFSLLLGDSKAIESNLREGRSQVYIYRKGELFFSGIVMIVERFLDEKEQTADVQAFGWYWLFSKRYIAIDADIEYVSQDAGAIAWSRIDTSQQEDYGDLGITQGTIETSVNLTLTDHRTNVKDGNDDLITQSGIEFEITPLKVFNVFYPYRGTDKSDTIKFQYPGTIKSVRSVKDATTIVNDEYALGQGTGDQEITAERNDVGSEEVYGLFQKIASYKDVDNVTALGNMAEFDVTILKSPRLTLDLEINGNDQSPSLEEFGLGDSVRCIIEHNNYSLNQIFRVFEIQVFIDENDRETYRLVVAIV